MLWQNPGFTAVAVLTLALGIAANTTIFSVINALILSPVHIDHPELVAAIWRVPKDQRFVKGPVSYLELQDWRRGQSFAGIAAYKRNGFVQIRDGQAELAHGMRVSSNFLSLLRLAPALGRDFLPEEELRGARPVAILTHAFAQSRFGGDEQALGQQLLLNDQSFSVIGILPPDFEFPLVPETEVLTTVAGEGENLDQRGAQVLHALGRLKPGVSFAGAQAELSGILKALEAEYPEYSKDTTARLVRVDEEIVGLDTRRALWMLLGAVGFVLLIACTNVSNLLLLRGVIREKEMAVRAALGAGTWRLVRHLFIESLWLAVLAGGAGLLLSFWGLDAIQRYGASQLPRLEEVRIDARVLGFAMAVSLLTSVLFSMVPILKAIRPDLNDLLKSGTKGTVGGGSVRLWRDALVVAEVALGLVLLTGGGLMVHSFVKLLNVPTGFNPENVLMAEINLTRGLYGDPRERVRYVDGTLERLKALPGVESAAFIGPMPFSGGNVSSDFRIQGRPAPEPGHEPLASNRSVTADYFRAIGIPLRKGRFFDARDRRGSVGAAIINEALAHKYFAGEDPIGRRLTNIGANQNLGDPDEYEIVGVVGDVHHSSLIQPPTPEIFLPFQQNSWDWGNFFVRTHGDPAALTRSFAVGIRAADPTVLVSQVQPLTRAVSDTLEQTRFYTLLFVLFGLAGLVLTLSGIYSVIAYAVAQRTREIGIRMALGAESSDVLRLLVGQGMIPAAIGIAVGLVAAWALTRLMAGLLFSLSANDPPTFALTALLLALVSLLACWIPARRATRVEPMITLRCE
jgi:putative ABC transport system permease protein